jgi:hypothetical protein
MPDPCERHATRYFSAADVDRSNVGSIETALMRCDAADSALARYSPLVAALEEMASQVDESHVAHAEMAEKSAAARAAHSAVSDQSASFREGLNADLAKEKELLETAKTCAVASSVAFFRGVASFIFPFSVSVGVGVGVGVASASVAGAVS